MIIVQGNLTGRHLAKVINEKPQHEYWVMTVKAASVQLAASADLYVNDAFGSAHRAHASTEGVTHFLKPCVAGFLMQKV